MHRCALLIGLAGCGSPGLKEGFQADLEQGWACGEFGYVALDKREQIRLEVSVPAAQATFPDNTARFVVFTGKHLIEEHGEDPCDDRFTGDRAKPEFLYEAIAGTAVRFPNGEGLGITVDDLVLSPDPGGLGVLNDGKWD